MKYRIILFGFISIFFLSVNIQGQYKVSLNENTCKNSLTGNLNNDLMNYFQHDQLFDSLDANGKPVLKKEYSPLRAALYSTIIPGAGQFYTKSYWQSAAFFGSEVLLWVVYEIYENRGDRRTEEFQTYADQHWSIIRYAHWIRTNYSGYYDNAIIPTDPLNDNTPEPWRYVVMNKLNSTEESIGSAVDGQGYSIVTGFTHMLAPHGDQQYYEMIGKYAQFGGGWDDAGSFTANDAVIQNVSPRFLEYSRMRGDANNFYDIATTVSYVILANHVFSALEAAWNASKINHRIQLQGHIQSRRIYGNMVEFVPTLNLKYEL